MQNYCCVPARHTIEKFSLQQGGTSFVNPTLKKLCYGKSSTLDLLRVSEERLLYQAK